MCYIWLAMRLELTKRKARDAAFAETLKTLHPENALLREMIAARVRKGLTQAELAQRMGTKQSGIARIESGRISPSIKTLRKLAEVTGSRLVLRLDEIAD
jgi:ribosome-binding protein aMBF1 (putative translation factor)